MKTRAFCMAVLAAGLHVAASAATGPAAQAARAGELRPGAVVSGFAVRSVTPLPEVKGRLVRMTYERNGADLAWLDRDDDNKTFAVAFRTIPDDDTGVAHIIEHSVLCGSEKYPVKEPFVELKKSSFATYINAWTGSDCTAYPVCSRNDADFMNLMDVYLDAVFHPLSVKSPLAFRQEGWHYEIRGGELVRNGVVLNEMRGCYGSPNRLARRMLGRMLYPDNCYGRESGGDPAHIHELTWEKYRDFYRRHYHPSNARIFLDGRIDLPATLAKLDAVLSAYPRAEISSPNPVQKPVRAEKTAEYELGEGDSAADKTLYLEGWVYGTFRDHEARMGLDVLTDALADSNEAPLKKALLARGLCEDVSFDVDCDEQIALYLCVKNIKDGKAGEVRRVVQETLASIAGGGVDKARLGALIDRREFRDREMDYGGFPRGLVFFRRAISQWLYGGDPADGLRSGHVYSALRAKAKTGWFEDLLRRAVVDNPHHAALTLVPSKALGAERRRAEKAELAAIQAKWTPAAREQVLAECRALDAFQKKVESPEDLAKLPRLSLRDIPEEGPVPEYSETSVGGVRVIRAKTAANAVAYLNLYFELAGCSGEDLSDAAVLSDVLGDLPTAKRGVMELKNALDAGLGRFQTSTRTFAKPGDAKEAKAYLVVSVSALDTKLDEIARLVPEVLRESSFADADLVGDVVKQRRRGIEETLAGIGGSGFAARRALASQSVQGAMEEHLGGIAFLRRLQRLDDSFAAGGAAYCRRLEALARRVFVRAGLTACLSDNVPTEWLGGLFGRLPAGWAEGASQVRAFSPAREGFRTAGKVGAAAKASFPNAYSGSGCVAATMLSLDYLWNEIRVLGGAYGGGFVVRPGGAARYSSWNDPKPARSLGVYDGSGDALRRLVREAPSLDNYIISTVSGTEPYLTPSVETAQAAALALSGRTREDLRRVRREMLHTTKADLLRFAGVLDSITNSASVCVVGGAAQMEACTGALDRVESVALPAQGGPQPLAARDPAKVWDIARLKEPPRVREYPAEFRGEATPVFIAGEPYRGRETWCFAYYGVPAWASAARPAPGIVLVHGGLGTAYPEWVRMWVRRGYAAICVDTCGALPVRTADGKWLANPDGGPRGWGRVECADEPEREQWLYHAVAAAIRSHSFLRTLPGVDTRSIGVTGISWGGFLTCILAAADDRLAYAVPVYGCGFNYERGGLTWNHPLVGKWASLWDASVFLPFAKCPMLWVDGTNDFAFSLDRVRRSAALAPVEHAFSTRLRMVHAHGEPGEGPREILAFADHFAKGGADVVRFGECRLDGQSFTAKFDAKGRKIVRAELLYTLDGADVKWDRRLWRFAKADALDAASGVVSAEIPDGAFAWVVNLVTDDGLVFSTPYRERADDR